MPKKISSAQMRAARALLRWSALDLAKASKVGGFSGGGSVGRDFTVSANDATDHECERA
jgi:hypothetical protein